MLINRKCVLWLSALALVTPYRLLAEGTPGKIGVLHVFTAILNALKANRLSVNLKRRSPPRKKN